MIGNKINAWTVLEEVERDKWGSKRYKCRCDCGVEKVVTQGDLKTNKSSRCRDCGYNFGKTVQIVRITTQGNNYKHGFNRTPTYKSWQMMKERCNPKAKAAKNRRSYKWYLAKGIKVCERWMTFKNFLADMGEKPKGYQLDRIDGDGHYEPSNCRWVTPLENNHNRMIFRDDPRYDRR